MGNSKREWRIGETTDDTERTVAVARAIIADRTVSHVGKHRWRQRFGRLHSGWAVDDLKVRVFNETAVATGRIRATGSYRGMTASVVLRFTDVFVRRNGRWQIVASQGTVVAQ